MFHFASVNTSSGGIARLIVITLSLQIGCVITDVSYAASLPIAQATMISDDGKLPLASARYPKGDGYIDLAAAGYVEEEYYLSGNADAVSAVDGSVVAAAKPYVTRILIERPKSAARFSGDAIVEPFSFGGERAGGWTKIRRHVLAHGNVWIGITLLSTEKPMPGPPGAPGGLQQLKNYDATRYDPLKIYEGAPGDFMRPLVRRWQDANKPWVEGAVAPDSFAPQGQMILAELASLIKSNGSGSPLKDLHVKRFYTLTWQIQAQLWIDYIKQGRFNQWRMPDGKPLIDGYMLGNVSTALPIPNALPKDVPLVIVRSSREIFNNARDGIVPPPDADQPMFRLIDFNGSAHIGSRDVGGGDLQLKEVMGAPRPGAHEGAPRPPRPEICTTGHSYDEPVEPVITALFADMVDWVQSGKPMPHAPRVDIANNAPVKDLATGDLEGGLEPPWIVMPAATYLVGDDVGCGANDVKVPYDSKMLKSLYGDYATYAKRYDAAVAKAVKARFILPEDAGQVTPIARPEDFQ